jgi:ankyrin
MLFVTCVHPALTKIMLSGPEHFDPDDILQYIIENAIGDLNKHFNSGIPPLSLALELHSTAAVSLLLSKKEVDVDIRKTTGDLRTALEIAAFSGCTKDAARELLSRTNNSVYGFDPVRGYTILHFAVCDMSDQMVLRELLQSNVNIEALNRAAETPLDTAISKGNLAAVKLLLEAGANTKVAVGDPPMYPLHLAAQEGRLPIVQALVEFGADVNASSENTKSTALHYASKNSAWDLISFLIKNGALLDARDIRGATPFLVAARAKRWHIVRKFTTTLADLSATDFSGLGALHRAILAGSISVVRFLQEHCPAATQDIRDRTGKIDGNFLTSAIESGNVDLFHMFWEDGAQSFVSDYGHGLAHFAMEADVNDVRNLLLLHNIDWKLSTASLTFDAGIPEYPAPKGLLPLHVAAAIENNAAIAFLNDHDFLCDINALTTGAEAYSSLHLAAMFSGPSTVKLLKTLGADLDIKDAMNGQTPLHIAARLGFVDIVTVLLDAGCEPNPVDIHGITPELLAIEHKHHSAAKVLSQHLDSLESTIDATGTANSSASVLKPHPGKPWRLPLARSPHMTKVMTENISIYAIHDSECPETLYNSLEERKDYGVYYLGKPLKRLI